MMHVVDIWPGKEKMAALGLVEKDIQVDADVYRHYVEKFRLKFTEFVQKSHGNSPAQRGGDPPAGNRAEERTAAADEGLLAAFEQSQAPFSYYRGGFYRYRVDRFGDADRPIILERVERDEITGLPGCDGYLSRKGLLMLIARRIDKWLSKRQEIG